MALMLPENSFLQQFLWSQDVNTCIEGVERFDPLQLFFSRKRIDLWDDLLKIIRSVKDRYT